MSELPDSKQHVSVSSRARILFQDEGIKQLIKNGILHMAIFGEPMPKYEELLKAELKRFYDAQPFLR